MRQADLAIIVPAYDEAATIAGIVRRARLVADLVIVVDDGSADATAMLAASAGATVLRNRANLGKGASLTRGLLHALSLGAERLATLDGDGQHRPEDVARLAALSASLPGRIVIGSRRGSRGAPRSRYIANRVADFWISWAAGDAIADSQSGLRLYPAEVLRQLDLGRERRGGFTFESELLIDAGRMGIRTAAIGIEALYDPASCRPSHFRPVPDVARIVGMVAGKLLRSGMYPAGLWRLLTTAPLAAAGDGVPERS